MVEFSDLFDNEDDVFQKKAKVRNICMLSISDTLSSLSEQKRWQQPYILRDTAKSLDKLRINKFSEPLKIWLAQEFLFKDGLTVVL